MGSFGDPDRPGGRGAWCVTTVGSEWKAERALALGAAGVINHDAEDDFRRVGTFTGGHPIDVVLDPVGAATFAPAMRTLGPTGATSPPASPWAIAPICISARCSCTA